MIGVGLWTGEYHTPTNVQFDENKYIHAAEIGVGGQHTCVFITSEDEKELTCWGANYYGLLGDGTNQHRVEPTFILSWSEAQT